MELCLNDHQASDFEGLLRFNKFYMPKLESLEIDAFVSLKTIKSLKKMHQPLKKLALRYDFIDNFTATGPSFINTK